MLLIRASWRDGWVIVSALTKRMNTEIQPKMIENAASSNAVRRPQQPELDRESDSPVLRSGGANVRLTGRRARSLLSPGCTPQFGWTGQPKVVKRAVSNRELRTVWRHHSIASKSLDREKDPLRIHGLLRD